MAAIGPAIGFVAKATMLADAAARLVNAINKVRGRPPSKDAALTELKKRVAALETYNGEQAEVISQLAVQNQLLAEKVAALEAKRKGFLSRFF